LFNIWCITETGYDYFCLASGFHRRYGALGAVSGQQLFLVFSAIIDDKLVAGLQYV
jgi:hypothetical protein